MLEDTAITITLTTADLSRDPATRAWLFEVAEQVPPEETLELYVGDTYPPDPDMYVETCWTALAEHPIHLKAGRYWQQWRHFLQIIGARVDLARLDG